MAATFEQVSSRLFDLESDFSSFKSPPSIPSISGFSSSSSDLGCPSLTASSTCSSQGLADSESDVATPPESPSVFELTSALENSLGAMTLLDEMDSETPQVTTSERKGYFPFVEMPDGRTYMPGQEKRRLRTVKRHTTMVVHGAKHVSPITGDLMDASDLLDVGGASEHSTSSARNSSVDDTELHGSNVPLMQKKAKKQYLGLGLGLPSTWDDQHVSRSSTSATSFHPVLCESPDDFSSNLDRYLSPKKLKGVLRPLDAVLAFVQSPSPIEQLPPLLLSKAEGEHHEQDSEGPSNKRLACLDKLLGRSNRTYSHAGLGISMADDSGSVPSEAESPSSPLLQNGQAASSFASDVASLRHRNLTSSDSESYGAISCTTFQNPVYQMRGHCKKE